MTARAVTKHPSAGGNSGYDRDADAVTFGCRRAASAQASEYEKLGIRMHQVCYFLRADFNCGCNLFPDSVRFARAFSRPPSIQSLPPIATVAPVGRVQMRPRERSRTVPRRRSRFPRPGGDWATAADGARLQQSQQSEECAAWQARQPTWMGRPRDQRAASDPPPARGELDIPVAHPRDQLILELELST